MSDLRNSFSVATDDGTRDLINEEMVANGMGDLRRGWNAGRIGNEANYLAAQELGLRKDGRHAEADMVRAQIDQLNQRQSFYAPAVGRVEDIGGIGDGVDWLAGQVGQGAASMLDPMAVGTAIGAAGRVAGLSKNQYAQMFSKAAPYLAGIGAYGVGQRQMTGEMGNAMAADPQVMANTTPQQRWLDANAYGAGAGMLDTFLPGHLAGKVAGKGIVKALAKGGARAAGVEMLGEGATEAAQEYGKQQVLGQLNPGRDTSGDASDLLNSFAGGVAGAGGPVALGAGAHAVHNRIAKTADALGEKAGDVTDLVTGATAQAQEKGKGFLTMAGELFRGAPKDLKEGAPGGQDGAPGRFSLTPEELAVLRPENGATDPSSPEYLQGMLGRMDFAERKLGELAGTDPKAADLLRRMQEAGTADPLTRAGVAEEGANYIESLLNSDELDRRGTELGDNLKIIGNVAGRAGAAAVKGVAKGLTTLGKAAWEGATSKKNAQSREGVNGHDDYTLGDWRRIQAERDIAKKYIDDAGPIARDAQRAARADLAARQAAEFIRTKYHGREGLARMASHVTFELLDASYGMRKTEVGGNAPAARNARLNRIAGTMQRIYGTEDAMKMADSIANIVGGQDVNNNTKYLKQAVEYVKGEIQHLSTSAGKRQAMQERHELAETLLSMVPPERESKMLDAGINIRQTDRNKFLELLEGFADGTSAPGMRNRLNAVFGFETVKKMVDHLNGVAQPKEQDEHVPSGRVDPSFGSDEAMAPEEDYDAEKKWAKGEGDRIYGFHRSKTLRSRGQGAGDIFAGTKDAESGEVKRPRLLKQSDMVTGPGGKGKVSAIEKKIADVTKELGPRAPEYRVASRPVLEVMREHGAQPTAVLTAYRDYLRQDAKGMPDGPERKAALSQAMQAARAVLDSMRKPGDKSHHRLTGGERSAVMEAAEKYFSERHVVEAAKMVEAMPDQMDLPTILKMAAATRKAVDLSRKPGVDGNKILDDNNILTFSREKKPLHIRADDLVKWAVKQRRAQEASDMESNVGDMKNATRDAQYLTDLSSAISAVMNSGLVDKAMPYKTNARGERESFKDGIPPSLRLSTTTQKERTKQKEKELEGLENQRPDGPHFGPGHKPSQDGRYPSYSEVGPLEDYAGTHVAKDQDRGESPEPDMSGTERDAKPAGFPSEMPGFPSQGEVRRSQETLRRRDLRGAIGNTKPAVRSADTDVGPQPNLRNRLVASGELTQAPDSRGAIYVPGSEKKTGRDNIVPSELERARETDDFGHKIGKDEFSDQRYRSRVEGYDAANMAAPKSAMRMRAEVDKDAADIIKALTPLPEGKEVVMKGELGRPAEGFAMIESRLRAAAREFGDGSGLSGGIHYIYPVLKVLNGDKVGTYDFDVSEMKKANQLRASAAMILIGANISDKQRVFLAKELATGEAAARINLANVKTALTKIAEAQAPKAEATAPTAANDRAARLDKMIVDEDYSKLTTKDRVDRFLRAAKDRYAELRRMEEETGLSPEQKKAYDALWEMFNPRSTTDLASFYDGIEGAEGIDDDQVRAMLSNEAASEVAAQAPKSQSAPAGARIDLGSTSLYGLKDQKKSDQANKFIGRGSEASSTAKYAKAWGERANTGKYTASDVVFVSAEGNRGGRIAPDFAEIGRAVEAGATIITDDRANRERSYNVGEREVAKFLYDSGYREVAPGQWKPGKLNAQTRMSQLSDAVRNDQVFPNDGPNRVASDEDMAKAKEYLAKVAPQIKVHFENITGYSGEFIEAENVIKISTTAAAGTMETAYHEALHAFFAKLIKSDPKVLAAMRTLAENEKLLARVHALLKGFPAAQRQLADGEERLAYIFQFWAAGKLDLPVGRPTTIMQKLRKFFRRVAGMITNEERAVDLMHAFHEGKLAQPSAAGRVIADIMNQGTMTPKQLRKIDSWTQRAMGMVAASEEILAKSESKTARELAKDFFTNPGDEDSAGHQEGYLNATRTVAMKYTNRFASIVRGLTDRDMTDVVNHMMNKEVSDDAEIAYAPVREAVKSLRALLREVYEHGKDAGVEMGEFKGSYFPRVWSATKLVEKRDDFIKMLVDNYPDRLDALVSEAAKRDKTSVSSREAAATEIWQFLANVTAQNGRNDVMRQDGVLAPFFASGENRHFAWIETRHSGEFQHKNLTSIVTGYIHQGVKAAEYTRRFGREGKILENKLRAVRAELHDVAAAKLNAQEFNGKEEADKWVESRMKNIERACGAMEGTLGKDVSPALRKFNSWMMVYQNLRLLPLTLFASVVDPLGMVARGATMKEAYETFLRGMREVFNNWADMVRENPKERQGDKWTLLAEHIGALDSIMLSHHVSEEYSSSYLSPGAKKINDMLFKINGMESWNRGVRSGAVRSAVKFIERHSKLPEVHSDRWLKELGLTPEHIALDSEGELILDANELAAAKGISMPEAKRRVEVLHSAINRWVQGAILTPNAAQRPAWSSDPHYSVFFHLKQFSYSFHQTILKRAVKEMNHGNLAPIGAFAGYIPVMIASDVVKGLIVGGGELPAYMKGYDLGDWVKHGIERSGTLGIAGIGVDASHDIFSLAGPGAEQLTDALIDPIGDTTIRALPLNPLYAQLLK